MNLSENSGLTLNVGKTKFMIIYVIQYRGNVGVMGGQIQRVEECMYLCTLVNEK